MVVFLLTFLSGGVDAVEPASSKAPPEPCILLFESALNTKSPTPEGVGLFVVGEDGFEPSKRYAADLQSVPFGHSGTPPYTILFCFCLEPVDGLEPPTY